MTQLILNAEQSQIVAKALEPVEVCAPNGEVLGVIEPAVTREEIADAKQRLATDQPRYTTAQVLEHLQSLENR
jgi:hypothetical protein